MHFWNYTSLSNCIVVSLLNKSLTRKYFIPFIPFDNLDRVGWDDTPEGKLPLAAVASVGWSPGGFMTLMKLSDFCKECAVFLNWNHVTDKTPKYLKREKAEEEGGKQQGKY